MRKDMEKGGLNMSYVVVRVITYANCDDGEHGDVEIHHCVEHQMEHILIEFIL